MKEHTQVERYSTQKVLEALEKEVPNHGVTVDAVFAAVDTYHHEHTIYVGKACARDMALAIIAAKKYSA